MRIRKIYNANNELVVFTDENKTWLKSFEVCHAITDYYGDYSVKTTQEGEDVVTDITLNNITEEDEARMLESLISSVGVREALGYMKKIHSIPTALLDEEEED